MTKEIGSNTKKVWEELEKTVAGVSIQELCKQLALTFEEVMTAVRWIAREHNIGLANNNGSLMVIGVHA
ncbi:winged helix-turn-helix domain-containing protein [Bacteroides sp. 51]|uniref:winged helix-turn-helix domain-containing protein n=1 Tax=Bacteroides sp. 51 TaxID=2302938 RepID=UPI0013CFF3C7|nr:winged helix-turn-helix domain-containing protein [Bacteroides sp. 51]NDV82793.1 hypothetical protein [Bacteroides sp. 51]